MPLKQLLTERSDERHSPHKSASKTTPLFFCAGHCTWKCLVSVPARAISHGRQERLQTAACRSGSDRNESSRLLLFRRRRRECFSEGPPLGSDNAPLRSGWAAASRRAVSLHPLCWLPWRCSTFSPSLFSEWAPLSGKHLSKQCSKKKSLRLFLALYAWDALCPFESLRLLELRDVGKVGFYALTLLPPLVHK